MVATLDAFTKAMGHTVGLNYEQEVSSYLDRPVTTQREVLTANRAYHIAVIRPEFRQIIEQIEQFLIALNDRAIQHHENIN